jgi:DNA-directed RNA polymerase specialized sigma54-like protein
MKKLYDLSVRIGEYQKDGETKGKYLNVGCIMEKDDGGRFILLNRTFNPAGVQNPENRESLIISMFKKKSEDEKPESVNMNSDNPFSDDEVPF